MSFVVDASVALSWLMPDEGDLSSTEMLRRAKDHGAVVPSLWWYEVRNTLIVNERRGRIDAGLTGQCLAFLKLLPITVDDAPVESSVLELARRHRLTVYDAVYLELAQRLSIPIATADRALIAAIAKEGVAHVL